MNKVIYKYPLKMQALQNVVLPKQADVLTVAYRYDKLVLWAMVNPDAALKEHRGIEILCTGQPLTDRERTYISTVQVMNGMVYHIFEIEPI